MNKMTMKALRVNAGFTQKKAAKALGVSLSTLCSWEKNYTSPPFEKLARMASLYGCEVGDFSVPTNHA